MDAFHWWRQGDAVTQGTALLLLGPALARVVGWARARLACFGRVGPARLLGVGRGGRLGRLRRLQPNRGRRDV